MDRRTVLKLALCAAALPAVKFSIPKESMPLKLGKGPSSSHRVAFRASDYLNPNLPTPPDEFGHYALVASYGMLQNDNIGDCTCAGAAHEHLLWAAEGGNAIAFTDKNVIDMYEAVSPFREIAPNGQPYPPNQNPTDQGAIVADVLTWRQKVGITDAAGNVHKLAAYAKIPPGDTSLIAQCTYLFSATAIGVQLPDFAVDQFKAGHPWDVTTSDFTNLGGHYICALGMLRGYFVTVTWGRLQLVSPAFLQEFCDEAYALFSPEMLKADQSPEGFDLAQLQDDVKQLVA